MKRLLLFLCAGMTAAGCVTQPDGTPLFIMGPNLVLAEGLFTTYRIAHTTDDCDKIDVPGVLCTIREWDFEGTTLEVEVPEGFEHTGTGRDNKEYWFSVRCARAPASGEGEVKARVMAEGRARYEGLGKVSCRPIGKGNLTGLSFSSEGSATFGQSVDPSQWSLEPVRVVSDAWLRADLQLEAKDGTVLSGYGREVVPADGSLALREPSLEAPPTPSIALPRAPELKVQALGGGSRLRVGTAEIALPVEAVADSAWDLTLAWSTDEKSTRVNADAKLLSGARVFGATACTLTFSDAAGEKPPSQGSCTGVYNVPNVTKVCVELHGKTVCK